MKHYTDTGIDCGITEYEDIRNIDNTLYEDLAILTEEFVSLRIDFSASKCMGNDRIGGCLPLSEWWEKDSTPLKRLFHKWIDAEMDEKEFLLFIWDVLCEIDFNYVTNCGKTMLDD